MTPICWNRTKSSRRPTKPASKSAGQCLTERPKGYGRYNLEVYISQMALDPIVVDSQGNVQFVPKPEVKERVLDTIKNCDKNHPKVRRALDMIAQEAPNKEIREAAKKALKEA